VGDSTFTNGALFHFDANNDLFGLQLGASGTLWQPTERFRIESTLKSGVYVDAARASLNVRPVGSGGGFGGIWFGRDHTSFVGDLSFAGVYQLTDHLALRGGYQLLWLSGVAVASEQIPQLNFTANSFQPDTSHGAFFHGALVGLEATW
jgi:hypothetical protein